MTRMKIFVDIQKHYNILGIYRASDNHRRLNWKVLSILFFLISFDTISVAYIFLEAKTPNEYANTFNWTVSGIVPIFTFWALVHSPKLYNFIDNLEEHVNSSKSMKKNK